MVLQNGINANTVTPLNSAAGGSGINNSTYTITLGGNFTTSGSFNTTFTTTATTSVTLPTSGKINSTGGSYHINQHLFWA